MKTAILAPVVAGIALLLLFQNCSQKNMVSASDISKATSTTSKAEDSTQIRLDTPTSISPGSQIVCPAILCAAPPMNCHYEQELDNAESAQTKSRIRGCNSSCGKLVCHEPGDQANPIKPKMCPMIACATPDVDCGYVADSIKKDDNGCDLNCGQIKCKENIVKSPPRPIPLPDPAEPKVCPMYRCQAPPTGCKVNPVVKIDADGCPIGCGDFICDRTDGTEINPINVIRIKPKIPILCPEFMCAAPRSVEGSSCQYQGGSAPVDENGCATSCGIVICLEEK